MGVFLSKAGFVGYFLFAVTLFATAVILYKFYFFHSWHKERRNKLFLEILSNLKKVIEGESRMNKNDMLIFIENELAPERRGLQRYLASLASISSIAPLLGLLGTILGMVRSTKGILKVDNNMLLKGISEALLTTAIGIMIAIPVILAYNFFVGKIKKIIEEFKEHLLARLEE